MYVYQAYGLGIHSVIPLPELRALAEAPADVSITIGRINPDLPAVTNTGEQFHFTEDKAYLFWDRVGKFEIREAREIIVEPASVASDELIRLPLLGAVLSVLLYRQGYFVLHASAVEVDGRALVFLGAKGSGKSTTAATLYSRGHDVLADDAVALDIRDPLRPLVVPGFPQLKLWPDAAVFSLGDDPENLPQLVQGSEKRSRKIDATFPPRSVPLGSICAISDGPVTSLKLLPPQEAMIQLIGHSYVSRFGRLLLHGSSSASHFRQCSDLAANVAVYRLERPRSLTWLAATSDLLEQHATEDAFRQQPVIGFEAPACP